MAMMITTKLAILVPFILWVVLIPCLLHSSESARTIAPSLRGNNDGDAPSSTAPSDSSTTDHHHHHHDLRNHRLQHRSSRGNGGTAAVLPLAVYGPPAASSGSNNNTSVEIQGEYYCSNGDCSYENCVKIYLEECKAYGPGYVMGCECALN